MDDVVCVLSIGWDYLTQGNMFMDAANAPIDWGGLVGRSADRKIKFRSSGPVSLPCSDQELICARLCPTLLPATSDRILGLPDPVGGPRWKRLDGEMRRSRTAGPQPGDQRSE